MDALLLSTTAAIAALAFFLIFITALKYAVPEPFVRTRLGMTAFFIFIVFTLTAAYWRITLPSLWFSLPALLIGMVLGHFVGVRAAQDKLMMQGMEKYMEHFAHVHFKDFEKLQWWSVINFYSVAGALVVINLLGLSVVIFGNNRPLALLTCAVGAFLVGTIVPYLVHLWSINTKQNKSSTTSEA